MAKNITLAVDEEVLARYRVLAAEQGTSVNALVRKHMEEATGVAERRRKAREWMRRKGEENIARDAARLAEGAASAEDETWRWNREEIYADRLWPKRD